MALNNEGEPPPHPTDLEGWRRSVRDGCFVRYPAEAVVAAIQDLGPTADTEVINALALHVSETILRTVRRHVGKNHPNQGADIVDDAHGQLIQAVLCPSSADGKGLREAFVARVRFRTADAIREDGLRRARECSVENLDAAFDPKRADDMSHAREMDGRLFVEEVLSRVADERKRLAFRLHMDGIPLDSKRTTSIADVLGVSSKTAGHWIEEVQAQLKHIAEEQS